MSAFIGISHSPLRSVRPDGGDGTFARAIAEARAALAHIKPDLVVFFGPEHRRTLADVVPPFSVVTGSARGYGDWGTPETDYAVHAEHAETLLRGLGAEGFDVARGRRILLDHGFGESFVDLFGTLDACPVVPVIINCAEPPLPSFERTLALGEAVGRIARAFEGTTLFIGSGGLSHDPPLTEEAGSLSEGERVTRTTQAPPRIDEPWDRRVLAGFAAGDWAFLRTLNDASVAPAGTGAHEVRTWLAAFAASGVVSATTHYEPVDAWITGMGIAWGGLQP
jgi:2,3-dihydroxyphenylpropionate 1,2-dioxygenase